MHNSVYSFADLEDRRRGGFAMGPFGSNLKRDLFQESGVPVLRGQNLRSVHVSDEDLVFVSPQVAASLSRSIAHRGDIVITHRGTLGQVSLIPNSSHYEDYLVSQSQLKLTLNTDLVIPSYLNYWLRSRNGQAELLSFASQTGVPAIAQPLTNIRKIHINLPPLHEQRRIAGLLGALDDKIESNRHIISHSESLIIAQFHSLFTTGQTPVGTALSALMEINPRYPLKKGILTTKVSMQDVPVNSPMVDTFEVTSARAGSRFSNGDVLFARISPCLENGKTAIVDFLHDSEVGFGSTEFIVLSPQGDVSTAWIYALARDPDFRESCRQAMNGSSGRQRLSADFFSKYTIEPPHEGDLAAFNTTARPLLTLMGVRRDENKRLTQLRDALLPELMSGRMHVNEAGRLISEALDEEVGDA